MFTGIHDEDMQHRELLEYYGPVYGVPLRSSLPMPGKNVLMRQALPTRQDLEIARKVSERTAAGYEVLLSKYNDAIKALEFIVGFDDLDDLVRDIAIKAIGDERSSA